MMRNLRTRTYTSVFSGTVLALVFAVLWVCTQSVELWVPSSEVKDGVEAPVTVRLPGNYFRITMLRNEVHYLATASSTCPNVFPRGAKVSAGTECSKVLHAFEAARRPIRPTRLLGSFALFLVVGLLLSAYMRRAVMGRARWFRCQVAVFVILTVMAMGSKAILLFTGLPAQILPVAMVPLLATYYLGRRLSFCVAFAAAIVASSLVNYDVGLFLIYLMTGVASVVVLGSRRRTRVLVKAGAMAAWVAVVSTLVITLVFSGTLDIYDDMTEHVDPRYSIWLAALFSGIGSGLVAMLFAPIIGLMVDEVSRGRLLDLQDLDHPLLTRLRENAPSTWEHSRAMANLAEAATHAIGGNALLVRVGAYYHDVGKSLRPEYFIENQGGGENPHDKLSPHDSARAIFQHVVEGTNMLRDEVVPEDVIEFAYSHHGTGLLEFFWHKNLADGNSQNLTEEDFSYHGHRPTTRETGILMVVDAIEAAARTVDHPEKLAFEGLVQRIVFSKLSQGQLDETSLTLADLRIVSNNIVDTLVGMYHARIKYPWQIESTGLSASSTPQEGSPVVADGTDASVQDTGTGGSSQHAVIDSLSQTGNGAPVPSELSPEPAPEPVREPTPEPVREPTPEPVREPTPEPVPKPIQEQTPTTFTGPAPTAQRNTESGVPSPKPDEKKN